MTDDLKERFDELRDEERRRVPPFTIRRRAARLSYRWVFALLLVVLLVVIRPHRTTFSEADLAAARSIGTWHPPTDVLLKGTIR